MHRDFRDHVEEIHPTNDEQGANNSSYVDLFVKENDSDGRDQDDTAGGPRSVGNSDWNLV